MVTLMLRQNQTGESAAANDRAELEHELAKARRTIQKLKLDLAAADTVANRVAEILGACPSCWGLNRLCTRCQGSGGPGTSELKGEEFLAWLEPALSRLGVRVAAN
jgi:hypothetical protein